MSSLTLITGTLYDGMDINYLLEEPIMVTSVFADPLDPESIIEVTKPFPISVFGYKRTFNIVQGVSAGKTFYAVHLLAEKAYGSFKNGGDGSNCYANLGLAWRPENVNKPESEWVASLNSIEEFEELTNCTILADDISNTIRHWNNDEARAIGAIANAQGKLKKDIIITAQREVMIPPAIRDMATEWIVPIITRRNFTRETPRGDGYPEEMITLHFNGAKGLEKIGEKITGFEKTFKAYRTVEIAQGLQKKDGARPMQPGYQLEAKAFDFLKEKVPGMEWQHLNGKHIFDIISNDISIDVCDKTEDGDGNLNTSHKTWARHLGAARRTGTIPYLMFPWKGSFGFIRIKSDLPEGTTLKLGDLSVFKRIRTLDSIVRT